MSKTDGTPPTPFLKWVGGKRSATHTLRKHAPVRYSGYYEVFAGGGALFYALQPQRAYLADVNVRLIMTYRAVRDNVDALICALKDHARLHCKDHYLECRKRLVTEVDYVKVAAIMVYLNATCYNGLYRVNKAGGFNVPMGSYRAPKILNEENLRDAARVLVNARIVCQDFEHTPIEEGAFYYLDPPYHKAYSSYAPGGFGDDAHRALGAFCARINEANAYFMLSNSDTHLVRDLYARYRICTVSALRSVSCKAHQRGRASEILVRNY